MSVVFLTVVDLCGHFCRQTGGAAVDKVKRLRLPEARTDLESNFWASFSVSCAPQKICTTKRFQDGIAVVRVRSSL